MNRELAREAREGEGGGGGGEGGEAAARFGSAFAGSSATRALARVVGRDRVSDEAWRRAMFDGWGGGAGAGEGSEGGGGESTSGDGDASEARERAASTYVIDADEYRSSGGHSSTYISQSEYSARVAEFERMMRERFLDGGDDFDYARVDADDALDAHWRREMDQDAEDAYFDRD